MDLSEEGPARRIGDFDLSPGDLIVYRYKTILAVGLIAWVLVDRTRDAVTGFTGKSYEVGVVWDSSGRQRLAIYRGASGRNAGPTSGSIFNDSTIFPLIVSKDRMDLHDAIQSWAAP